MEQRLSLYLPIVLLNRPGRLDPGRNNLRLFTIKCLQNCPKVAMLYIRAKPASRSAIDRRHLPDQYAGEQGPAKIDLALWANGGDMFWLIRQDQRFIPAPRVAMLNKLKLSR